MSRPLVRRAAVAVLSLASQLAFAQAWPDRPIRLISAYPPGGAADLVVFGIPFIANPDLVSRLAHGHPLNAADSSTFYTGGEKGYIDYPVYTA